jgi:hypothetical protein
MRIICVRKNYFTDQILAVGHDQFTHEPILNILFEKTYTIVR